MTVSAGSLVWLRSNGEVLEAVVDDSAAAIERRRLDGVHPCLVCGRRAQAAYVAHTDIGPRWLDLCFPCAAEVRCVLLEAGT